MLRLKTREEIDKEEEKTSADYEARLVRSDVNGLSRAERRARARAIMKQQLRVQPERLNEQQLAEGEGNAQQVVVLAAEPDVAEVADPIGPQHLSRKERLKKAKASEKEERKMMQGERQKHQQEVELIAQQAKRDREKRQMVELENERQRQRLVRDEAKQKHLSEQKTFLSTAKLTLLVEVWIRELQSIRSVSIDEMARRFDVSSERVVERIKELIQQRRITGIISDSGRFIYVSEDEIELIAERLANSDVAFRSDIVTMCSSVLLGRADGR